MRPFHWKAQGDANFYVILQNDDWFAQVQLNGSIIRPMQEAHMDTLVDALNNSFEE